MPALFVSLLLVAHGLVHACFVGPRPPERPGAPQWPFDLERSWVLTPIGLAAGVTRAIGRGLVTVVIGGFALAALGVVGILPALFVPGILVGSAASIVLLALFFHPWLVLGLAIDAVLLGAVLANGWRPGGAGV